MMIQKMMNILLMELRCRMSQNIYVEIVELVKKFRKDVEDEVCRDPTQSLPTLYLDVRSRYTAKLLGDPKMLFLSEIPTYEVMASSLYRLRRKFIPAAPNSHPELNVDLDWFLLSPE